MSMVYKFLLYSAVAFIPASGFCFELPQLPQVNKPNSVQNVETLPALPTLDAAQQDNISHKKVVPTNTAKPVVKQSTITSSVASTPSAHVQQQVKPTHAIPANSPAMKYMGPGPVVISKSVVNTPVASTPSTSVQQQAKQSQQAHNATTNVTKPMPASPVAKTQKSTKSSDKSAEVHKQNAETGTIDEEHAIYINNEAIMLTISDDDVVLGKTTPGALIDNMPAKEYINEVLDDYASSSNMIKKRDITLFIDGRNIYKIPNDINLQEIKDDLFESIQKSRIDDTRIILDNTHLLQSRNRSGKNLLGVAVLTNDTNVTKFLLHRGVNINAIDYQGNTPMNIADDVGYTRMQKLLNRALLIPQYKSY